MEEQWEMLCEIMQERTAFVFSKHGCLTDTELHTALKVRARAQTTIFTQREQTFIGEYYMSTTPALCLQVLSMSKEEFSEFKDNEGWEDDDEEDEEKISQAFSNEGLPELKPSWKILIHKAASLTLRSYGDDKEEEEGKILDSDRALIEDKAGLAGLSHRQQKALQVRYGQKSILHRVMELTKS